MDCRLVAGLKSNWLLNEALYYAQKNTLVDKFPMAAILQVDNLMYIGYNSSHPDPFEGKYGHFSSRRHAEADCLYRALRAGVSLDRLKLAQLFVARAKKDGSPGLAMPCPGCSSMLDTFGITPERWLWTEG